MFKRNESTPLPQPVEPFLSPAKRALLESQLRTLAELENPSGPNFRSIVQTLMLLNEKTIEAEGKKKLELSIGGLKYGREFALSFSNSDTETSMYAHLRLTTPPLPETHMTILSKYEPDKSDNVLITSNVIGANRIENPQIPLSGCMKLTRLAYIENKDKI